MIIYTPKYVMKIIQVFATPKYFVNSLDTYIQTITDTMSTSSSISVTMNYIFSIISFILFVTFVHIHGKSYTLYIRIWHRNDTHLCIE
jgi:hypothetical protein